MLDLPTSAADAHVRHGDSPVSDEVCNGQDDDCDGQIDEGLEFDVDDPASAACLVPAGVEEQIATWLDQGRVPSGCTFSQEDVSGDRWPDQSACGRVVTVSAGTHSLGEIDIDVPTILVGSGDATIVGGLRVLAGVPVRVDGVRFSMAPFPGAIYAAHPDVDLTLVDVTVDGAAGFGVYQHGGSLRASGLEVTRTVAEGERGGILPEALMDPTRLLPTAIPGPFTVLPPIAAEAFARWDWLSYLDPWLARHVYETSAWTSSDVPRHYSCYGAGLYVGPGTTAELTQSLVVESSGAGLVVAGPDTEVADIDSRYLGNGAVPSNVDVFFDSGLRDGCWGGTTVRDAGVLLTWENQWQANNLMNILVTAGGVALSDNAEVTFAVDWGDGLPTDGAEIVYGGAGALTDSVVSDNDRAGVLVSNGTAGLRTTEISYSMFGLVLQEDADATYDDTLVIHDIFETNIVSTGTLPVPSSPLAPPGPITD